MLEIHRCRSVPGGFSTQREFLWNAIDRPIPIVALSWEVVLVTGKKQLPPVWVAGDDDLPGAINEPAEKVTPLSLHDAAESGTRLDELRALRRILIAHISSENILARDLSSLTLKLMAISKEIESLAAIEAEASTHGQQEVSKLDAEDEDFNPHSA